MNQIIILITHTSCSSNETCTCHGGVVAAQLSVGCGRYLKQSMRGRGEKES